MPEWIGEQGIGETRLALVEGESIVEARILLDGIVEAGMTLKAKLLRAGRNGVARDGDGIEYLLPQGAPGIAEGADFHIVVTRSAIPGLEPWKRPLAKIAGRGGDGTDGPSVKSGVLPADWNDVIEEARSAVLRFSGGELRISPTPAMTLIDVDGSLPPKELALAGAGAAARAIRRLDLGGSIGIDLPTIAGRGDRQKVGEAIDGLLPKPFERTAMNGFGFLQIVRPRRRASLIELAQDRAAFEARVLLRSAGFEPPGPKCLVAHPAVIAVLAGRAEWTNALAAKVGGATSLRADPALPISGGYAEQA